MHKLQVLQFEVFALGKCLLPFEDFQEYLKKFINISVNLIN